MARITIIETGQVPQKYRERHGSFPDMFERMVRAEDPSAEIDIVSIPNGDALPDPRNLDAVLITGAAAGVYDGLVYLKNPALPLANVRVVVEGPPPSV